MRTSRKNVLHDLAVERSEIFLSSLVENLPDMIFVKEASDLKFVRLNHAAEELIGFSREEVLGKNDYDFFPKSEADSFTAKDRAVLAGRQLIDIPEEPIHTRGRGLRFLHTKKIPIFDPAGRPLYLLGISEDITERKLAEEERDRSRSRVSKLEVEREMREQFVSTLSHDLRTPLSSILAAAQLLMRHPEQVDLRATLPERIMRSACRADKMIQDLLDVTRIAAGHPLPLMIAPLDLASLAADVIADLRGLQSSPILVLEVAGPLEGYWSASELSRALENLVSNAIKYGAPGGVVTVAVRSSGREVEVDVHNVGDPIPAEEILGLFDPFHRSRLVEQKGTKGWGLGLALVKAIAEAHGGSVHVESSPTAGTRFRLVLPRDARGAHPVEPAGASARLSARA